MEGQLFLSFVFLALLFSTGNAWDPYAGKVSIQLINTCQETIWPAVHTDKGVNVMPTGLKLDPKEIYDLNVPDFWSGTIWARTGCSGNPNRNFHCDTGDCGTNNVLCYHNLPHSPASLLRFHLVPKGDNSYSLYKVDARNGFNVAVTLTPFHGQCRKILWLRDIRQQCPDWLAVYSHDARKIACKSPCYATGEPHHCCTGAYASPRKCQQNAYTELIENTCPSVVSNPFDDRPFKCLGGTSFMVSFC